MSTHTSLDLAATERKARLAKLKSLKRKQPDSEDTPSADGDDSTTTAAQAETPDASTSITKTYLSGRNYDPDQKAPKLGFDSAPNANQSTLELRAKEIAETTTAAAVAEEADDKGIDLFKLQPKKPNWDLKRDLAKKMEILNVRTDNAIARIVRERIEAQKKAGLERNGGGAVGGDDGGEEVGLKGEELVEGIHQREREEAEEERREDEDEDS